MRVIIVGGGINGLLMALALSDADVVVTLLERGEIGRESSWAGGGIVSPLYPWRYPPAVTALASAAQAAYPALAERLHQLTGIDPELHRCGMLFLDPADRRDALAWAGAHEVVAESLPGDEARLRWPGLPADVASALWLPGIANVRNPRLLRALLAALSLRSNVSLCPGSEVVAVQAGAPQVTLADGRVLSADHIVITAGAWTGRLLADADIARLPVRPMHGQMLRYAMAPGEVPAILLRDGHYLIPRRDGQVLCGSTLEDRGFDKSVTASALSQLQAAAVRLWPALAGRAPDQHWAGLRPGSPNGIPFIGPLPGQPGLWVNAGQHRNGLVLAPASAALLTDLMLGRCPTLDPAPYAVIQ